LHSAGGRYMEAVDTGISALEAGESGVGLHLALAEACLGLRDAENATAHAEEALDQAGGGAATDEGCEALLLLALASFNGWELETGANACMRVLAADSAEPSARRKRMVHEARALLSIIGRGAAEEEL
jgi:hypothetical protein